MGVSVAIVGASGYTGAELLRLLALHPRVEVAALYARRAAGTEIADVFPQFAGRLALPVQAFDADAAAAAADIAFCGLPHGQSARAVAQLRARGVTVIDLSADYRLTSVDTYNEWYGSDAEPTHPHPELVAHAVYGLPELHRESLVDAQLIASPGCYPTATLLAIAPLLAAGLVSSEGLVVDAKSGATGAGRSPSQTTHFSEMGEGVRAYKIGGTHRHTVEIEQELTRIASRPVRLTFTPHLLPMARGILSCVYAQPTNGDAPAGHYQQALEEAYHGEPFVTVLPPDRLPDTAHVRGSNRAHVAVRYDARARRVVALAAIDNLVKGASGQAVQSMNLAQGWAETTGLEMTAMFP